MNGIVTAKRFKRLTGFLLLLAWLPGASSSFGQGLMPENWRFNAVWAPQCLAYSPDGKTIAVGGSTGVQLYDAATNNPIHGFRSSATTVQSLAFSPDGRSLLIGGSNSFGGVVEFWNPSTAALTRSLSSSATFVQGVAYSPDGQTVAIVGSNSSQAVAEIWSATGNRRIYSLNSAATYLTSVCFSPNGKLLAVGGGTGIGGVLELWTSGGKLASELATTASRVASVAISPDGRMLADGGVQSFGPGSCMEQWSIPSGSLLRTFPVTQQGVVSVAFSPDGSTIAESEVSVSLGWHYTPEYYGLVMTWSAITGDRMRSTHWPYNLAALAYSPDGSTIGFVSTWSLDGQLQTLSGTTQTLVATGVSNVYAGSVPPIYFPDGKRIVRGGVGYSGPPDIWSISTGTWSGLMPNFIFDFIYNFAISPDGKTIAASEAGIYGSDGIVVFYDAATRAQLQMVTLNANVPTVMKYTPDGSKLAIVEPGRNFQIVLLDPETGLTLSTITTDINQEVNSLAFSPDGSLVAVGGEFYVSPGVVRGVVEVWNVRSGTLIASYSTAATDVLDVEFSPNGRTLAVGGYEFPVNFGQIGILELWNVQAGKRAASLNLVTNTTKVDSMAFVKGGALLFAATDTGVQVFNPITNQMLGYFGDVANSVAASPDGQQIAVESGTADIFVGPTNVPAAYPIDSFTLSTPTLIFGGTLTATVTLAHPAPAGGVPIGLFVSNYAAIRLPAIVNVPGGAQSVSFQMGTQYYAQPSNVVTAQSGPYSKSVTVNVVAAAPATLVGVAVSPAFGVSPSPIVGTVMLSGPAGPGEQDVAVTSVGAGLDNSYTVPIFKGDTNDQFTFPCPAVTQPTNITVTATLNGVTHTATFVAQPVSLLNFFVDSLTIAGPNFSKATLLLNGFPPVSGATATLSSSSPDVIVPGTVLIPSQSNTAVFLLQTRTVKVPEDVVVTATCGGKSIQQTVHLVPLNH